jgi:hypothetical protein
VPSPFRTFGRRPGPVGLALTALEVWRRIPPAQRRQIIDATRRHGPRAAATAIRYWRGRQPPRRPPFRP